MCAESRPDPESGTVEFRGTACGMMIPCAASTDGADRLAITRTEAKRIGVPGWVPLGRRQRTVHCTHEIPTGGKPLSDRPCHSTRQILPCGSSRLAPRARITARPDADLKTITADYADLSQSGTHASRHEPDFEWKGLWTQKLPEVRYQEQKDPEHVAHAADAYDPGFWMPGR